MAVAELPDIEEPELFARASVAEAWHVARRYVDAAHAWEDLWTRGYRQADAALNAAISWIDAGEHERGREWLVRAADGGVPAHEVSYVAGQQAWTVGELDEAERRLVESANAGGGARAWTALGVLSWQRGRRARGRALHEQALELDGDYALARSNLANVLLRTGGEGEAGAIQALLARAAAVEPHRAQPYVVQSRLLRRLGDEAGAREALARARLREWPLLAGEDETGVPAGAPALGADRTRPLDADGWRARSLACWLEQSGMEGAATWLLVALADHGAHLAEDAGLLPGHRRRLLAALTADGTRALPTGAVAGVTTLDDPLAAKAGWVLTMLREVIGAAAMQRTLDAVRCAAAAGRPPTTESFFAIASYAHGASLTWFANQWVLTEAGSELRVDQARTRYRGGAHVTEAHVRCRGFATLGAPVEVVLRGRRGETAVERAHVDLTACHMRFETPFAPVALEIDPGGRWYATVNTDIE